MNKQSDTYKKFQSCRARIRGITVEQLEAAERGPSYDHIPAMTERHLEDVRRRAAGDAWLRGDAA